MIIVKSYEKFVLYCGNIGKTPSRVALEAGISKPVISSWKSGRTKPTDSTMAKITSYLGVPIDAFKDDATKEKSPVPTSEGEAYWAERLSRLSPSDQALLGAVVSRFEENPEATRSGIGLLLGAVQSAPRAL